MKKLFSVLLVSSLLVSPAVTADDSKLPSVPRDLKLQKLTEEANRNKELLEIWKDHVRTITKERDEAYKQLESMKSAAPRTLTPAAAANTARFGQIETQALPAAGAAVINPPVTIYDPSSPLASGDIQGYQETIRDLRRQLDEIRARDQRMQKEIMEAGNDKTLIIKDKEQALARIETMTQQIASLKGENQSLTERLRSAGSSPYTAADPAPAGSAGQELTFLKNSYNLQSEKLKQAEQEKANVLLRAAELQKKYVDLQTSYEKLAAGKPAVSTPQDLYAVNELKLQNQTLKTDLEKTRVEAEKAAREKKYAEQDLKRVKDEYAARLAEIEVRQRSEKNTISASAEEAAKTQALLRKIQELQSQNSGLQANIAKLSESEVRAQAMSAKAARAEELTVENDRLKKDLEKAKKNPLISAAETAEIKDKALKIESENKILKIRLASEAERYTAINEDLKKTLNNSQAGASSIREENGRLRAEIQTLRAQPAAVSTDTEELRYLQRLYSDLEYKMKRREAALDQALKKIEGLKAERETILAGRSSFGAESEAAQSQIAALRTELESMKLLNRQLRAEKEKISNDQQIYQSASSAQKAENEAALSRQKLLENEKASLEKQISLLRAELAGSAAAKADDQAQKAAIRRYESEAASLRSDLSIANEQIRSLKAERERAASEQESYQTSSIALKSENAASRARINQLEDQLEIVRADMDSAAEQIRGFRAEREKSSSELQASQSALTALKNENFSYKTKIAQLEAQLQGIKTELESASSQSQQFAQEKARFAAERQQREASLATMASENESLKTRAEVLSVQQKQASAESARLTAERQQRETALASLSAENETLKARIEDLTEQNRQAASEASKFISERQQNQAAAASLKSESESLKARVRQAESEKETFKNQAAELHSDLDVANDLNKRLKEKYAAIGQQVESLRASVLASQAEKEKLAGVRLENDRLTSENQRNREEAERKIQTLKARVDALETQKQKDAAVRVEKEKIASENETMKKAMVDLEREAQRNEDTAARLRSEAAELRQTNASLMQVQQEQLKTIEDLKADLKKSLDDIQNLKSNFQAYLESLVTSFEERQTGGKKPARPAPPAELTSSASGEDESENT